MPRKQSLVLNAVPVVTVHVVILDCKHVRVVTCLGPDTVPAARALGGQLLIAAHQEGTVAKLMQPPPTVYSLLLY